MLAALTIILVVCSHCLWCSNSGSCCFIVYDIVVVVVVVFIVGDIVERVFGLIECDVDVVVIIFIFVMR